MRSLLVVLAGFILFTLGCTPFDNKVNPNENPEACSEFRFLESEALKTLQFEYPVEVSNVGFCICPVASISLTDANGDSEHFSLMWDLFQGISSATLHYNPIGREMSAKNDEPLVDASLTLTGGWIARNFTADEIALFATTQGPRGCKENEPEIMARLVLDLANNPR